ncbi:hypothetical protein NKG05_22830 [Oerskovia sp. M15]
MSDPNFPPAATSRRPAPRHSPRSATRDPAGGTARPARRLPRPREPINPADPRLAVEVGRFWAAPQPPRSSPHSSDSSRSSSLNGSSRSRSSRRRTSSRPARTRARSRSTARSSPFSPQACSTC